MASLPTPAEIEEQEMHMHDNMAPNVIAANAVCFTIACIAVILRFQARRMAKIRYEADDWLILAGLFFTLGVVICALLGVRYGSGRHTILLKNPADIGKLLLSGEVIWGFAISTIKGSLLYLYYRIFFVSRKFTIALCVVGVFVVCYCLTQSFASIFQCMPVDSNWTIGVKHYCVNTDLGATIIAGLNVLTDFAILILPMPLLYQLQKPLKERIQIMGMFLLGGLVCFASIYRCVLTHEISYTDPAWTDVRATIWTTVELCIGVLSACLPTMRPLFSRSRGKQDPGAEQGQEKSDSRGRSDQSLSLQESRSIPSQSKAFAHLGVLADVEHEQESAPEKW
ncbi:hypothetical protein IMSHALPRED_006787 [Imshaugia aleurites]|uniref:Rhodopsin domain-containing protein n=1 Tax=Imshaugia aleurites TaxID=172621 RepID=A0A8H3FIK5_9LECA|nr:hypothetical protein IMSHALPRED_006787 [Imshaugia aleurites]